jgi:hypothetical protein
LSPSYSLSRRRTNELDIPGGTEWADNPVTMARRHILGDLNYRCERVQNVPVYLENTAGEVLGFVIESSNQFADALTFHLADDVCKKVATGHFGYSCDYYYTDGNDTARRARNGGNAQLDNALTEERPRRGHPATPGFRA